MGIVIYRMCPPIELSNGELRTFVAKLSPKAGRTAADLESALKLSGQAYLITGATVGFAVVVRCDDAYMVHTLARPAQLTNHAPIFTRRLLASLSPNGSVESIASVSWVRPLNRHLQRLFGWGDVCASDVVAEVERAAENQDFHRIRTIVPHFANYKNDQMYEIRSLLSRIAMGLLNPAPAILDCSHNWIAHSGPCGSIPCTASRNQTWNRCSECSMVRCGLCVSLLKSNAALDECVKDHIEKLKFVPTCTWIGRPFYVTDSVKMSNNEKLEWLRAEFEPECGEVDIDDLPAFAKLCIEFFHATTEKSQKPMIFGLFSDFSGISIRKEADLPPQIREELATLWGNDVNLCRECGRHTTGGRFCGLSCEVAFCKQRFRCPKCGHLQGPRAKESWALPGLDGMTRVVTDFYLCEGCGHRPTGVSTTTLGGTRSVHTTPLEETENIEHAWKQRRRA